MDNNKNEILAETCLVLAPESDDVGLSGVPCGLTSFSIVTPLDASPLPPVIPPSATSLMPLLLIPGVTPDVPNFEDFTFVDGPVMTFLPFHPHADHPFLSNSLSEFFFFL